MANDTEDFTDQSAPVKVGDITLLAGHTQVIAGGFAADTTRQALLIRLVPGMGVTRVQVQDNTFEVTYLDVSFSGALNSYGPLIVPTFGTIELPQITITTNAAPVVDTVVASVYELDGNDSGWVTAPAYQPVPVTIVNPP